MNRLVWLIVLSLALQLSSNSLCQSPPTSRRPHVLDATVSSTKPDKDGWQLITLTGTIRGNYYLYANRVGNSLLESHAAQFKIRMADTELDADVEYPTSTIHKNEFLGTYRVWTGMLAITARVRRPPGVKGAMTVEFSFVPWIDTTAI